MATTPPFDEDLIVKAVSGDPWSLETLLIHCHDPLLRFIETTLVPSHQKTANPISAEDVLQETLMEAFRSIKRIEPRGTDSFIAWLKSIARTRHLNMLEAQQARKRGGGMQRVRNDPLAEATAVSILARLAGQDPTPSWIARRKETLGAIAVALRSLDGARRELIDLRYRQALAIEEIAARLGKSEGAVKMLLNRIIKDLQELISKNSGEFSAGA